MNPNPPTSTPVAPISAKQIFGIGGFLTTFAIVAFATMFGSGTANSTIAFSNETGYRCAACHATPGTNMQALTRLGQCFRNSGYNIRRCRN